MCCGNRPHLGGYTPESCPRSGFSFRFFPDEHAIQAMKDAGVTQAMVDPHGFARTDMELLAVGASGIRVYKFKR